MKKILIPLLLLAVAAGATVAWRNAHPPAQADGDLTLYGNIDLRLVNLAFEASGRIAEMQASEGARVAAGTLLAQLDTRRLELARDAATAKVAAQQAQLAELEAGTRVEEIRKLHAELEAAQTEAANAVRSAARMRDLEHKKLASPQQSDDARTAAEAAEAKVRSVRAGLELAEAGPRKEQIAAARASLAALEAEQALAERNLADARLTAPAAGVIQNRILEPGDMASPDRPVYTLALTEPLWARAYLAETELGKVKPGMPATVASDSFPGKRYPGWIGYISPSAEFTPKSVQTTEVRADLVYQVRVFLCDPQGELRLGMPVTVTLDPTAPPLAAPGCGKP
ncbi:HlyD family efflux transporter periplasmic adaptor subunit [Endothiovibrio diazotrophicus]